MTEPTTFYVHPSDWRSLPGSMRTRRLRKKRMKALGALIGVDMSAWWRRT